MEGPTAQMIAELKSAEFIMKFMEWEKKISDDGTVFYMKKGTQETSTTPDEEFLAILSKYETARDTVEQAKLNQLTASKETLANILDNWDSIDKNTTYKSFEDMCSNLDCWLIVPEHDRVLLFDGFKNNLKISDGIQNEIIDDNEEDNLRAAIDLKNYKYMYFENQSKMLQVHFKMLEVQEIESNKKTLKLRNQLKNQNKEIEELKKIIASIQNKGKDVIRTEE